MEQTGTTGVADVWRDQRQWSHAANHLKKSILIWRSTALALAILGAVLATLATQIGLETGVGLGLAIVSAAVLAMVPVIRQALLGRDNLESWARARSASEGLKAETYLYLTRTPPYDGQDRDIVLIQMTNLIMKDVDDLAGHTLGMPTADKPLPAVSDVESYVALRVQPQIDDYYRKNAAKQQDRLTLFRGIEFGLSLLAALLSGIAAATRLDSVGVWVGVVTTVAAAITVHMAAARYEHMVISYLATTRQLRALIRNWRDGTDKGAMGAARLIRDCEDVISRENESWMAAWSRSDDGGAPAPSG